MQQQDDGATASQVLASTGSLLTARQPPTPKSALPSKNSCAFASTGDGKCMAQMSRESGGAQPEEMAPVLLAEYGFKERKRKLGGRGGARFMA